MNSPATVAVKRTTNLNLYGAAAAVFFIIAVLWFRTGIVPAASGGDEVWWSESGYNFAQEGVLRWGFLDDRNGSAHLSLWPPVAPLLQAFMIRVFGLTALGIDVQSTLVAALIMAVVYHLGRIVGLRAAWSLWLCCAIFGLLSVAWRLVQVRMENLTALAALGFAALWVSGARGGSLRSRRMLAGACVAVGLFCYYPQSPFLLVAVVLALGMSRCQASDVTLALVGALPILFAGAWWIAPHWDLFRLQVLDAGKSDYWRIDSVIVPFQRLFHPANGLTWIQQVEKWAVLSFSATALILARDPKTRILATLGVVFSLPMFVYGDSPQVAAGVFGMIVLAALAHERNASMNGGFLTIAVGAFAAVGVITISLVGFTAAYQCAGRDYRVVSDRLHKMVPANRPTAIGQRAWLGLRDRIANPQLQFLPYNGPSLRQSPVVALDEHADDYFATLVLERSSIPTLRKVYPWLSRALDSGKFLLQSEITPQWKPLPWAQHPCYDLLVYQRVEPAPRAGSN